MILRALQLAQPHPDFRHMASSLPIDPAVDTMLDAFDRAKDLYFLGQPGPYRL
jgi:hypothetical protein